MSRRNSSPTWRPEGVSDQSWGTSVCACASCAAPRISGSAAARRRSGARRRRQPRAGRAPRESALALWRSGALALWRSGALALWRSGALALWRSGALALWRSGALNYSAERQLRCQAHFRTAADISLTGIEGGGTRRGSARARPSPGASAVPFGFSPMPPPHSAVPSMAGTPPVRRRYPSVEPFLTGEIEKSSPGRTR